MLTRGTKLGPYEIDSALGEGGMGQVYRARDLRLDRTVALKVLSAKLEATPDLLARFEREARAIAALQHPNICVLHDLGREGATSFLVMEYLEGETLAARLRRGALPRDQVVSIGTQVAAALDRAHRAGIVHRDLKPANIMLTKAGGQTQAKLLDFGLAKTSITSSLVPTAVEAATQVGTLLGTIPYMAPEQIEGREADIRSDIYAFGCVLYEMATGEAAFKGTRTLEPPGLNRLVQACLERNPEDRLQSAHDAGVLLAGVGDAGMAPTRAPGRGWLWPAIAIAAVVAAGVGWWLRPAATAAPIVAEITPPPGWHFDFGGSFPGPPVISPDGRNVVFTAANPSGRTALWLRPLDSDHARELPGTQDAVYPFWSPDSRSVGYFTQTGSYSNAGGNLLMVLDLSGGLPRSLAEVQTARGGTWSPDGTIVFTPTVSEGLMQVAARGGPATPVAATCDAALFSSCRFPFFLPDGRHYIYMALSHSDPGKDMLFEASLDGHMNRQLVHSLSGASFADGKLLYSVNGTLMAQGLNVGSGTLEGASQAVASGLFDDPITWRAAQSAGAGTLIYASGTSGQQQMAWVDRTGKMIGMLPPYQGEAFSASVSPDGSRIAVSLDQGLQDIWTEPASGGALSRLTFGPLANLFPNWAPDGRTIAYVGGTFKENIAARPADGGSERILLSSHGAMDRIVPVPMGYTADGRTLICTNSHAILALDVAHATLRTIANVPNAVVLSVRLSPDQRWISYVAGEPGQTANLFVVPYQGNTGAVWQVTTGGAINHFWAEGGRELDVIDPDGHLLGLAVTTDGNAPSFGAPKLLASNFPPVLAATSDGKRFLATFYPNDHQRLMIVSNWTAGH